MHDKLASPIALDSLNGQLLPLPLINYWLLRVTKLLWIVPLWIAYLLILILLKISDKTDERTILSLLPFPFFFCLWKRRTIHVWILSVFLLLLRQVNVVPCLFWLRTRVFQLTVFLYMWLNLLNISWLFLFTCESDLYFLSSDLIWSHTTFLLFFICWIWRILKTGHPEPHLPWIRWVIPLTLLILISNPSCDDKEKHTQLKFSL